MSDCTEFIFAKSLSASIEAPPFYVFFLKPPYGVCGYNDNNYKQCYPATQWTIIVVKQPRNVGLSFSGYLLANSCYFYCCFYFLYHCQQTPSSIPYHSVVSAMTSSSGKTLAPEIWLMISKHLTTGELNHMSLLSHYHLALFRPILYRILDLDECFNPTTILELLSNNKELARCVREFKLTTLGKGVDTTCYLTALWNMNSLKRLDLTGSIFNDESEQIQFVARVREGKIPLEGFAFTKPFDLPMLPGGDLSLQRLTSFSWSVQSEC